MTDNPSLSPAMLERYRTLFQGAFYRRFVLGEWVNAEGLVYDFFSQDLVREPPLDVSGPFYVSCDYGTVNPTSMGLWGRKNGVWYRLEEYYYNSRQARRQKTDQEYADDLDALVKGRPLGAVVVDPSAASFIEVLRRRGSRYERLTTTCSPASGSPPGCSKKVSWSFCSPCRDAISEFGLYRWDTSGSGGDRVVKEHDHSMDDIRYFAATVAAGSSGGFFAGSVERTGF